MSKTATPENSSQTVPDTAKTTTTPKNSKATSHAKPGRAISDPKEVAQLVMMRIDHVNAQKDELTTAVKALADTAKQLVSVYARQQGQIAQLVKRVGELEKHNAKS
jgi:hypothetical protein